MSGRSGRISSGRIGPTEWDGTIEPRSCLRRSHGRSSGASTPTTQRHNGTGRCSLRGWLDFPEASRMRAESIVLGSETKPLYVQEAELMERYVEAFERVLASLDSIMRVPHVPASEDAW